MKRSRWVQVTLLLGLLGSLSLAHAEHDRCGSSQHEGELLRLGNGNSRQGAVIYYQRQLAADEARLAADDPQLIADMEVLVRMHEGVGDTAAAEALATKAAERARGAKPTPALATALYGLGSYFAAHGAFGQAEELLGRAVACASPAGSLELTLALQTHAEALLSLKRPAEAAGQLQRALVLLKAKPRADLSTAFALRKLAQAYADLGQLSQAETTLAAAAEAFRQRSGDDYWGTAEIVDDHAQLLRRLGRVSEAVKLEAHARKVLSAAASDQRLDSAARLRWRSRVEALDARKAK